MLDVELIFDFHYIFPLFELTHTLFKYAQRKDVYIYDFVENINMCRSNLYEFYVVLNASLGMSFLMHSIAP
jgi:hypothetical protein